RRCPDKEILGRYNFTGSVLVGGSLRPLCDPDAPELDEDDDGEQEWQAEHRAGAATLPGRRSVQGPRGQGGVFSAGVNHVAQGGIGRTVHGWAAPAAGRRVAGRSGTSAVRAEAGSSDTSITSTSLRSLCCARGASDRGTRTTAVAESGDEVVYARSSTWWLLRVAARRASVPWPGRSVTVSRVCSMGGGPCLWGPWWGRKTKKTPREVREVCVRAVSRGGLLLRARCRHAAAGDQLLLHAGMLAEPGCRSEGHLIVRTRGRGPGRAPWCAGARPRAWGRRRVSGLLRADGGGRRGLRRSGRRR